MSWLDEFDDRLAALDAQALRRRRRAVRPETGARLNVDGESLLAFCSNDYLGLANDPVLKAAVHAAVEVYGVGAGASPMVSGHSVANAALELELAAAVQLPRALYFYAGYATNASIVPALVGVGDALFSDVLNHACLIDGARLSKAQLQRYAHADLAQLDTLLAGQPRRAASWCSAMRCSAWTATWPTFPACWRCASGTTRCCCWTTRTASACSGRAGPRHAGSGRFDRGGRLAAPALHGHAGQGAGRGRRLRGRARAAGRMAAAEDPQLHLRPAPTRRSMRPGGRCCLSDTAIQPLVIGDNAAALAVMARLHEQGLWVPAIRPPTVPAGSARLRIALSAAHSRADGDELLGALRSAARGLWHLLQDRRRRPRGSACSSVSVKPGASAAGRC